MTAPLIVALAMLGLGGALLLGSSVVRQVRRVRREDRWARFETAFREYAQQTGVRRRIHPPRRRPRNP